jgi:hypothetical protein
VSARPDNLLVLGPPPRPIVSARGTTRYGSTRRRPDFKHEGDPTCQRPNILLCSSPSRWMRFARSSQPLDLQVGSGIYKARVATPCLTQTLAPSPPPPPYRSRRPHSLLSGSLWRRLLSLSLTHTHSLSLRLSPNPASSVQPPPPPPPRPHAMSPPLGEVAGLGGIYVVCCPRAHAALVHLGKVPELARDLRQSPPRGGPLPESASALFLCHRRFPLPPPWRPPATTALTSSAAMATLLWSRQLLGWPASQHNSPTRNGHQAC